MAMQQNQVQPDVKLSSKRIGTGLGSEARLETAAGLSRLLADSFLLYLKTLNYHWNVTGPMFTSLHTLFEKEYTELAESIDVIAERIRALGAFAPGTFKQFTKLTSIDEEPNLPTATGMIKNLIDANEMIVSSCRELFPVAAADHDEVTADLLTNRMRAHEKSAWMLRSLLE